MEIRSLEYKESKASFLLFSYLGRYLVCKWSARCPVTTGTHIHSNVKNDGVWRRTVLVVVLDKMIRLLGVLENA